MKRLIIEGHLIQEASEMDPAVLATVKNATLDQEWDCDVEIDSNLASRLGLAEGKNYRLTFTAEEIR